MPISKESPIAIIGAGAWGLSTALHLNSAGYRDITIFDRSSEQPSRYSAAWDLNKIVRAEYEDRFYTDLALEAIEGWKTPLFGPYFHQTGYVVAATGSAPRKAINHLEKALASIESDPTFAPGIRRLNGKDDFKQYTWQYSGPLSGFRGYYNRLAGYAHSSDTLVGISKHLASRGVKFIQGEQAGKVESLIYSNASSSSTTIAHQETSTGPSSASTSNIESKCTALRTADGKLHPFALTICALGAYSASLLPALGQFTTARSWSVAHIQLTEEETSLLRGIPTTNVRDLGFFFEPDLKTRLFKLCPLGAGYSNTNCSSGISLPPSSSSSSSEQQPSSALQDYIPAEDERKLRRLLRETFPWMADRPFVEKILCWFSDTADSEYIIDFVPRTGRSVMVLSGDSGHGFKMMPVFGKWVLRLLEEGGQGLERWKWRGEDLRGSDWGGGVSWRIGEGREVRELVVEREREKARL